MSIFKENEIDRREFAGGMPAVYLRYYAETTDTFF